MYLGKDIAEERGLELGENGVYLLNGEEYRHTDGMIVTPTSEHEEL